MTAQPRRRPTHYSKVQQADDDDAKPPTSAAPEKRAWLKRHVDEGLHLSAGQLADVLAEPGDWSCYLEGTDDNRRLDGDFDDLVEQARAAGATVINVWRPGLTGWDTITGK
jgi:hypothetical protein